MGDDQQPRVLPLPGSRHLQGLLQRPVWSKEAHLRRLLGQRRDQYQLIFQGVAGQEGCLVPSELVLSAKALPALLCAVCLLCPALEYRMAEALAALSNQYDAAPGSAAPWRFSTVDNACDFVA